MTIMIHTVTWRNAGDLFYLMENVKEQHQRELASLRASYEAEVQQVKRRFEAQEARLRSRQAEELRRAQQTKGSQPK